jgi:hypothetical protein
MVKSKRLLVISTAICIVSIIFNIHLVNSFERRLKEKSRLLEKELEEKVVQGFWEKLKPLFGEQKAPITIQDFVSVVSMWIFELETKPNIDDVRSINEKTD